MAEGESRWTEAVFRNLQRDIRFMVTAGSAMCMDSVEVFRRDASRWLSDATNLRTKTIERADWQTIYEHFKSEREQR